MTWVTFRRFRFELITLALALTALGAWLVHSGWQRYAIYDVPYFGSISVAACVREVPQPEPGSPCYSIIGAFLNQTRGSGQGILLSRMLGLLLALTPPLVGALLGAPLIARELERGTFRLVWTQSRTRGAWLRGSVLAAALAALALVGAITLTTMWWRAPLDAILGRFQDGFELEGVVPLAYVLFALALGIVVGVIMRSSVPAILVTLTGYYLIHIPLGFLRARYLPPLTLTYNPAAAIPANGPQLGDWQLTSGFVDSASHPISQDLINTICGAGDPTTVGNPTSACVHAHGWLYQITWQPDSRFWLFQGIESAIFVALAAALLALAVWWVRRRLV